MIHIPFNFYMVYGDWNACNFEAHPSTMHLIGSACRGRPAVASLSISGLWSCTSEGSLTSKGWTFSLQDKPTNRTIYLSGQSSDQAVFGLANQLSAFHAY